MSDDVESAQLVEHFPELADDAADLVALCIVDARVIEQEQDGAWQAIVVLHSNYEAEWCATFPWALAMRRTETEARGAIVELLRGLAATRRRVVETWPPHEPFGRIDGDRAAAVFAETLDSHDHLHSHRLERKAQLAGGPGVPREPTSAERWGATLRVARRAAGLTQKQLAERYELTQGTVSTLERGQRTSLRWSVVRAIATDLGVAEPHEGEVDLTRTADA